MEVVVVRVVVQVVVVLVVVVVAAVVIKYFFKEMLAMRDLTLAFWSCHCHFPFSVHSPSILMAHNLAL